MAGTEKSDGHFLQLVERATQEPIVLGDFVRLASGSPLGLVVDCVGDRAEVVWITGARLRSSLPSVCLRPERRH